MLTFELNNTCPKFVSFDINDNILTFFKFDAGCDGCFKVLYKLLMGKNVDYVIDILNDCKCNYNSSNSCLVQLSYLLQKNKNNEN
jgi:hypothetical protein